MAVKGKATAASKPQKPSPAVEDDELDDLLDDSDLSEEEEVEEEAPAPKAKAKAKAKAKPAPEPEPEEEEEEEELDLDLPEEVEEEEEAPAPKAKAKAKAKPAAAAASEDEKKIEGLTKATQESGVITFNESSGSQGILILVTKLGFDREKVLKVATSADPKFKKFNEKYFSACDVTKKYGKVIGIIKKLQDAGYKLPSAK